MKTQAKFFASLVLAATCAGITSSRAATTLTLDNGPGFGTVGITVDGFGAFGSAHGEPPILVPTYLATFTPVGSAGPTGTRYSTTFESGVGLRFTGGSASANTFLSSDPFSAPPAPGGVSSGNLGSVATTPTSLTSGTSTFAYGGLNFSLEQHLEAIFDGANQVGSRLVQTYNVVNANANTVSFDLMRYMDADFQMPGGDYLTTGGGRLVTDTDWLVSTLTGTGPSDPNTFAAIAAEGGTKPGSGRYQMIEYPNAGGILGLNASLTDTIAGDGGDADQFVEPANTDDYVMAMVNGFTLGAGAASTYTTYTIFATGAPDQLATVPETSTVVGGVMLIGFMAIATVQRRRRALNTSPVV